ncbi:MAG: MBL fold metallo-hydrolase [Actinomycetota bacterium]
MLRVVRVLAPNPSAYTLEGTNTWVVGGETTDLHDAGVPAPPAAPTIVIDPGPEDPAHLDEVARAAGAQVAAVLVTHDHPDHAPGAATFAEQVQAPLYAFRLAGAEHLRDGQIVSAGDLRVVAVHTPGHTSDHVVFHVPAKGALFAGDAVLGRGTSFIDPPDGDLGQYLRSLGRMQELAARTIYPGHGPVVLDAAEKLREYVEHRAQREQQVVDALSNGARTIEEMVSEIYAAYPPELHELAGRSVLAHLLKLSSEGRAAQRGRGDDATWEATAPRSCQRCGKPVGGRALYCGACSLILLQEGSAESR